MRKPIQDAAAEILEALETHCDVQMYFVDDLGSMLMEVWSLSDLPDSFARYALTKRVYRLNDSGQLEGANITEPNGYWAYRKLGKLGISAITRLIRDNDYWAYKIGKGQRVYISS